MILVFFFEKRLGHPDFFGPFSLEMPCVVLESSEGKCLARSIVCLVEVWMCYVLWYLINNEDKCKGWS